MKISQLAVLAVIALALTACNDREDRERAINEGRAASTQVSTTGQETTRANDASAKVEPPFAATCRKLEGRWNVEQQQCDVTAAVCSNAAGVWQARPGHTLERLNQPADHPQLTSAEAGVGVQLTAIAHRTCQH